MFTLPYLTVMKSIMHRPDFQPVFANGKPDWEECPHSFADVDLHMGNNVQRRWGHFIGTWLWTLGGFDQEHGFKNCWECETFMALCCQGGSRTFWKQPCGFCPFMGQRLLENWRSRWGCSHFGVLQVHSPETSAFVDIGEKCFYHGCPSTSRVEAGGLGEGASSIGQTSKEVDHDFGHGQRHGAWILWRWEGWPVDDLFRVSGGSFGEGVELRVWLAEDHSWNCQRVQVASRVDIKNSNQETGIMTRDDDEMRFLTILNSTALLLHLQTQLYSSKFQVTMFRTVPYKQVQQRDATCYTLPFDSNLCFTSPSDKASPSSNWDVGLWHMWLDVCRVWESWSRCAEHAELASWPDSCVRLLDGDAECPEIQWLERRSDEGKSHFTEEIYRGFSFSGDKRKMYISNFYIDKIRTKTDQEYELLNKIKNCSRFTVLSSFGSIGDTWWDLQHLQQLGGDGTPAAFWEVPWQVGCYPQGLQDAGIRAWDDTRRSEAIVAGEVWWIPDCAWWWGSRFKAVLCWQLSNSCQNFRMWYEMIWVVNGGFQKHPELFCVSVCTDLFFCRVSHPYVFSNMYICNI